MSNANIFYCTICVHDKYNEIKIWEKSGVMANWLFYVPHVSHKEVVEVNGARTKHRMLKLRTRFP